MTTYSRKPDVVDAWQFTLNATTPSWLDTAVNSGQAYIYTDRVDVLDSSNTMHSANVGDYVLRDTVTGSLNTATSYVFDAKWEADV